MNINVNRLRKRRNINYIEPVIEEPIEPIMPSEPFKAPSEPLEEEKGLTIQEIEEIASKFELRVNQTNNYIAIKKNGRLNVATISNDMKSITVKKDNETFPIANRDDLEEIVKKL